MEHSNKFAWTWMIKADCLDEYVKMHLNPWPEIVAAHKKAGIRNYSIFQNGRQFFYCLECDNVHAAFSYLNQDKDCKRWNAVTSRMVEGSFDFSKSDTIVPIEEVFYLE